MEFLKIGDTVRGIFDTINGNFSELSNKRKIVFSGSAAIPSNNSGNVNVITTTTDLTKFDGLIFQRADCNAVTFFIPPAIGTVYKIVSGSADFSQLMTGLNLFECNAEITAANEITLSNNVYSGVKTNGAARYIAGYTDNPLIKVIGFKV